MKDIFDNIPKKYIYSINGRDNILLMDALSYLQFKYGPHITKKKLCDALTKEGFKGDKHVALVFEGESGPTSTRSWSRLNPDATATTIVRPVTYTKSDIFERHIARILHKLTYVYDRVDKDFIKRDDNVIVSDLFIKDFIKKEYPGINTIDLRHIVNTIKSDYIPIMMRIYNDNESKSRYWKSYIFIYNNTVDEPETDNSISIYEESDGEFVIMIKYYLKEALYTIAYRNKDFYDLKTIGLQLRHIVNNLGNKNNALPEGVYDSERYIYSRKSGALDEKLFKK